MADKEKNNGLSFLNEMYDKAAEKIKDISSVYQWKELLDSFADLYNYSFKNNILIREQCPKASFLTNYEDWQNVYGGQVARGSKAVSLYVYCVNKITTEQAVLDKDYTVFVNEKGMPLTIEKENKRGYYNIGKVFDISQVIHPNISAVEEKSIKADLDILSSAVNKLLGDNSMSKIISEGNTDLTDITQTLLNNYLEKIDDKPIRSDFARCSVNYVISKALDLPFNGDLTAMSTDFNKFDTLSYAKFVKSKTNYILKKIDNEINISENKVKDYDEIVATGKFNIQQLYQIKTAFENGISAQDIAVFAKPQYDAGAMIGAIAALNEGITRRQLKTFLGSFSGEQMQEIIKAYKNPKTTPYQLATIKNPDLTSREMEQINRAIDLGATPKEIQILVSASFDWTKMFEIVNAIEDRLSLDEIKFVANNDFNAAQMCQLRLGFSESKLSMDEVKLYAYPDIDNFTMVRHRETIKKLKEQGVKEIKSNSLNFLVENAKQVLAGEQKKPEQLSI